jgi:hypothetical protein
MTTSTPRITILIVRGSRFNMGDGYAYLVLRGHTHCIKHVRRDTAGPSTRRLEKIKERCHPRLRGSSLILQELADYVSLLIIA